MVIKMNGKKKTALDMLGLTISLIPTLQSAAQQSIQLRVDLRLLLQHVEQQLVLGGTVDLCLLQPALHHLQLGFLLRRLQTLMASKQQEIIAFKQATPPSESRRHSLL